MNPKIKINSLCLVAIVSFLLSSCSKEKSSPDPSNPCDGKNIVVTGTVTAATACSSDGSITAAATGTTGFTFKLNQDGVYQSSPTFDKLAAGVYTLFAKDGAGCEKSTSITITSSGTAGALFTKVKTLMAAKCQSCHNNSVQNGGMNWQVDCNIVANQARIKERAVDIGDMPKGGPSLTQSEKAIITDWIAAGGAFTN